MTNLEKIADMRDYSPQDLFLLSALGGAGGFGGLRLLTDMMGKSHKKPKEDNSAVHLSVPAPRDSLQRGFQPQGPDFQFSSPKTAGLSDMDPTAHANSGYVNSLLPVVAGLPAGFLGAKLVYDKYKKHDLDKDVNKAKKKYLDELQLSQAQLKTAGATPCVDEFCAAIACELNETQMN